MSYTTYTRVGPFVDNGAPGIDHNFLNGIETFLLAGWFDSAITSNGSGVQTMLGLVVNGTIKNNPTGVVLNGGTAGTATLYQDSVGNIKRSMIILAGFRTAGAAQTIVFPTAYTKGANLIAGEIGQSAQNAGFLLLASSVAQTIRIMTSTSSTGSTYSNAPSSIMYQGLNGDCKTGFDTIQFPASGTNPANGYIIIVGQ